MFISIGFYFSVFGPLPRVSEWLLKKAFYNSNFTVTNVFFCDGTAELEAFRASLVEKAVELMGLNHH